MPGSKGKQYDRWRLDAAGRGPAGGLETGRHKKRHGGTRLQQVAQIPWSWCSEQTSVYITQQPAKRRRTCRRVLMVSKGCRQRRGRRAAAVRGQETLSQRGGRRVVVAAAPRLVLIHPLNSLCSSFLDCWCTGNRLGLAAAASHPPTHPPTRRHPPGRPAHGSRRQPRQEAHPAPARVVGEQGEVGGSRIGSPGYPRGKHMCTCAHRRRHKCAAQHLHGYNLRLALQLGSSCPTDSVAALSPAVQAAAAG